MMRTVVTLASMLVAHAALAARPPLQSDFDRCTLRAEDAGVGSRVSGAMRLHLLLRTDGSVYAGYVRSDTGDVPRLLERCVLYAAMRWTFAPSALDYEWPYPVRFIPGGASEDLVTREDPQRPVWDNGSGEDRASVILPDFDRPPAEGAPLDVAAAGATLEIADGATVAEQGVAELAAGQIDRAVTTLRKALAGDPANAVALRALSQALTARGELGEARALATQLVALDPQSEAGHEAMLRVCLAERNDACAFEEFQRANHAPDLSLRWLTLRDELLHPAQDAAARLRSCAASFETAALCAVKRCAGGGDFQVQRAGATAVVSSGDTRWVVKDGSDGFHIVPATASARTRLQRCAP